MGIWFKELKKVINVAVKKKRSKEILMKLLQLFAQSLKLKLPIQPGLTVQSGWTCPLKLRKTAERGNKKSPRIALTPLPEPRKYSRYPRHHLPEPEVRKEEVGPLRRRNLQDRLKARGDRQSRAMPLGLTRDTHWRAPGSR